MKTILDIAESVLGQRFKLAARSNDGPEYAGPCLFCGGDDRFRIWPENLKGTGGRAYCRGCGWTGDAIDSLRCSNPGISFREAQATLGDGADSSSFIVRQRKAKSADVAEKELREKHVKTAVLAQRMYESCGSLIGCDYLDAKGVHPCPGLRALSGDAVQIYGEKVGSRFIKKTCGEPTGILIGGTEFRVWDLVMPVFLPGNEILQLSTIQFINADRIKALLPGGKKQGGFFPINVDGADKPLCIAEGLATALSIYQSTGYGVLVAVDAGNMLNVARYARQRYPDREIVLVADNDEIGIKKARQAAAAIGACLVNPGQWRGGK